MSCIKLYNDLNSQFTKIRRITYLLNKRDLECVSALENWFVLTEIILHENNVFESELITQLKGQLIIERIRSDNKLPRRKKDFNAVSKIINPLKETILKIIEPVSDKINRREILIERIINAKEFSWNEDLNYRDYILAIWRTLLNEERN